MMWDLELNRTGSEPYPMIDFDITVVFSNYVTTELVCVGE
jgi:hypothetical protein